MRATLCSRNPHKARELEALMPGWSFEILDADDYPQESGDTYYAAPVTDHSTVVGDTYYDESPIIVTAPRASDDVLITDDVVDRIASDPRVSGNIGVDTFRGDVTLTGRTGGTVQKDFAEQDAKSVDGVNNVENYIRPRVGGM